jgi:tetratricopeptide (TPR) repeat protein
MSLAKIQALRAEAGKREGAAAVALLQEAERLAEGNEAMLFTVRLDLCYHAVFAGLPQAALVAFTWCLQAFDRNPNFANRENPLLWRYKYVIQSLPEFPQISREQMRTAVADFQERLKRGGHSGRTGLYLANKIALGCGDTAAVRELSATWPDLKRDSVSDCHACETDTDVHNRCLIGQHQECLDRAEPLLKGQLRCAEVPHITLPHVAHAYFHLGKMKQAKEAALEALRLTGTNADLVGARARVLELYVLMREWSAGLNLLERDLPLLERSESGLDKFRFKLAAVALLEHVLRADPAAALHLSDAFLKKNNLPGPSAQALFEWLTLAVEKLIGTFDTRNGNTYFHDRLQMLRTPGSNAGAPN